MTLTDSADKPIALTTENRELGSLAPLVEEAAVLAKDFKKRKNSKELKNVHPVDVPDHEEKGWLVQQSGKRTVRMKREKHHDRYLEDRLWCLLYSMGYRTLNSNNFAISFTRSDGSVGKKQVDVYAEDDETALVVECKSRDERGRRSLQKDIQETISLQSYFRATINRRFSEKPKPKIVWIYATRASGRHMNPYPAWRK